MTETNTQHPIKAYSVLAVGVTAIAMAAIFIRLAQGEGMPSLLIAGGRLILATLLLTPAVLHNPDYKNQIRQLSQKDLLLSGVSGFFLAMHFASWVSSLEYTTVLISGVLVTTTPIWTALLEIFILKARLSKIVIVGLVIAITGGMIIGLSGGETVATNNLLPGTSLSVIGAIMVATNKSLLGAALAIIGAITVAVYMIIGRRLRPYLSLTPYIWMVYGIAGITMAVIIIATQTPLTGFNAEAYLWLIAIALVPQMTGHTSINYALAYLPATYISLVTLTEPIMSAIAAYIVFTEVPTFGQVQGGVVILLGVGLATFSEGEFTFNTGHLKNLFKKKRHRDLIWVIVLMLYIVAGIAAVPFHGDESTTIWMSKDYDALFIQEDVDRVRYNDPPVNATEQHMRLITGSLTKYLMGISWQLGGYDADEINEQWDWGADWRYNQMTGHAPDDTLLFLGRLPVALMTAAGVAVIFAIGMSSGKRPVAYFASFYYAMHPAILLNGRRAMFEGGLLLFSLLAILVAIWWLRKQQWRTAILMGVTGGLALAAKHPALTTLVAVYGACGIYALAASSQRLSQRRIIQRFLPEYRHQGIIPGIQIIVAGILAAGLFYALNPVWWGDPITRAEQVYEARKGILAGQVAAFGGYEDALDQFGGFGRQVFGGQPQYYEVDTWEGYIADQIDDYDSSLWAGVNFGKTAFGAIVMLLLTITGWIGLWNSNQGMTSARWLLGVWTAAILLSTAILTPIEWQRYYLMTYPVIGLLIPAGAMWLVESIPVNTRERVHIDTL